jgi:hypothetical protein
LSDLAAASGSQSPERRTNVIKDSASGFNELKASNRRTGSPVRALKQNGAEPIFEIAQTAAESRLAN